MRLDIEISGPDSDPGLDPETEIDPVPVSVEEQAIHGVKALADRSVIDHYGGQNVHERALKANEIACQLVAIDGVQDFVPSVPSSRTSNGDPE